MNRLERYLERIAFTGRPRADLATLDALHRQHLLRIPYENLDVMLGHGASRDPDVIFEKIVTGGRGGWCYEMNGLFAWALEAIGFRITRLAAGVDREQRGDVALGNHLALWVHLEEGDYLADVGFGDGALLPLPLCEHAVEHGPLRFRLERLAGKWWRFHNHPAGAVGSFDFELRAADEGLLDEKCHWLQSEPESPFRTAGVCMRHLPEGGVLMLRGRRLRRIDAAGVSDHCFETEAAYLAALDELFDLTVAGAGQVFEAALAWERRRAEEAGTPSEFT